MKLTVTADTAKAEALLTGLVEKQIPFAKVSALNALVLDSYDALKAHTRQRFVLRKPDFVLGRFRLLPADRATKAKPVATVYMRRFARTEYKGGLLAKFIEGGTKQAQGFPIAIPTQAIRPSFRQLVPQYLFPKALGLQQNRYTISSPAQQKRKGAARRRALGKDVRFFIRGPGSKGGEHLGPKGLGIYRATGRRIELIWAFRNQVPIPKRIPFDEIVQRTISAKWSQRFSQAMAAAVASGGYKGAYGPQPAGRTR